MKTSAGSLPEAHPKRSPIWPIFGAFAFFLLFWYLGYPEPAFDDLFYNGAALNMAQGGDFSNPLLVRQGFPSHYFFVYPPVHPYTVYAWLSLFGISAASLLAFQNLVYLVIAVTMILLMRRQGAPRILSWLVPLAITAVFLKSGLRPEGLAVALIMSGFVLQLYYPQVGVCAVISFFLIFLGCLTAPRTGFFGATLALVAMLDRLHRVRPGVYARLHLFIVSGLALALAILVILALIRFRIVEFWHAFYFHSARRGIQFYTEMGLRWLPLFFLTVFVLCLALKRGIGKAGRAPYFLAVTFTLAGAANTLAQGSAWCVIVILFLLTAALASQLSRSRALILESLIAFAILLANGTRIIELYGIFSGNIERQPSGNRAMILTLQSTVEHPLLIDSAVARYVYDYKLPNGIVDFDYAAPFPGYVATDAKLRTEDIFVLGPGRVTMLYEEIHADPPFERWSPLGNKDRSYPRYPCQAFVIPARDYIALEEKNLPAKN